jgi:hypothetical protein
MIPKKYLDKKKRMKWSYIFNKIGEVREPFSTYSLIMLIDKLFPHSITPGFDIEMFNDKKWSKEFDVWCSENLKHGWTMWATAGDMRNPTYHFETATDALLFKMKWTA